jgi:hypothetical protein
VRLAPDCEPGALPPFGRLFGVPTLAGHRAIAIRMRATEFVRLAGPRVGPFAVSESAAAA